MDRMAGKSGCRGLTLVEMMITLVVLAITVAVVAPAMQQSLHGNRLRTEAGRLVVALNLARSEAVARNTPVSLCPSAMASTGLAACSGQLSDGWLVFTNRDRDGRFDADVDAIIRAFAPLPPGYFLGNRAGTRAAADLITYLPDGSSRRNLTLLLCPPGGGAQQPWSVVLNMVGRVRTGKGEGRCPAGPG